MQEYRWDKEKNCWMIGELTEFQYRVKQLEEWKQHAKEHPEQTHCYLCKQPLAQGQVHGAYGYRGHPLCYQCSMSVE